MTDVLASFPRERRWLLPALQAVQAVEGHLSEATLSRVALHLRVPVSEVYGVASGYPELRLEPRPAHHVRVCTGVTCTLLGGRALLTSAQRSLASTADVTVEPADCFFACSVAPLVEVDGRYRGRVAVTDLERLGHELSAHGARTHQAVVTSADDAGVLRGTDRPSAQAARDDLVDAARRRAASAPSTRLLVQAGTCGCAVGGADVVEALREAARTRPFAGTVVEGACNGMCYAAPTVTVERRGAPTFLLERVAARSVATLLDALTAEDGAFPDVGFAGIAWSERAWRGLTPVGEHPFWKSQQRALLARVGRIDPESLDDALLHGSYAALARALDTGADEVIAQVEQAGLQGRGGAFFPAAVKWQACRKVAGEPKYLVMNGEEGEPGIFKDRHLMEGDPHRVLEGALLAAYAAGASHVILYVHGEAELSAARLARAVADARAAGIVGARMLGRDVACDVEIRRGAGGFVLGEETALLESIEGRRAQPRTRPPFPVEAGLWGRPTVINNVETLAAVPVILELGADTFRALGTASAPGTKVFGVSGPIARSGVVEVRNGVTLSTLLREIGGGLDGGKTFLGAVVGGPSGSIVPADLFDVAMEPRGRVSPGTGGIVGVPSDASVVEIVRTLLAFNAQESCGKCTPCREGAPRLRAMLDVLASGAGGSTLARARELAETMQLASLCGLGQAAPLSLIRAVETFPHVFPIRDEPSPSPVSREP